MLGYRTRRMGLFGGEALMTPLRQRFLDDLRLRNYSPRTLEAYVAGVARLARHFGRSPDQLGAEEVRSFQLHLLERKVSWSQFNQTVCALRFFYGVTLGRPEQVPHIPYGKRPKTLPCVLSPAEVLRLLEAAPPGRDRVLLVLHTWGQNLHHHPHIHAVVTGGGLACNARGDLEASPRWQSCRPGFFLPVRVLSRVFRGKYLDLLRRAFDHGQLVFPGRLAPLADRSAFTRWLTPLYRQEWVVYAKRPFGGPAQVLKYLARYTHRVAISNQRLVDMTPSPLGGEARGEGTVTFRYKDYADAQRQKTMTVSAEEFLRRFVQHVLPQGFVKIRHYGLLANRSRAQRLALCRSLLLAVNVVAHLPAAASAVAPAREPTCPQCGGSRLAVCVLLREPALPRRDTS
jgi:hypothetical protein